MYNTTIMPQEIVISRWDAIQLLAQQANISLEAGYIPPVDERRILIIGTEACDHINEIRDRLRQLGMNSSVDVQIDQSLYTHTFPYNFLGLDPDDPSQQPTLPKLVILGDSIRVHDPVIGRKFIFSVSDLYSQVGQSFEQYITSICDRLGIFLYRFCIEEEKPVLQISQARPKMLPED